MKLHQQNGLRYYTFDSIDPEVVTHAIFTRQGGYSKGPFSSLNLGGTNGDDPNDVIKNHHLLFETIGRPYNSRFDVWQVHGKTILFPDKPRPQGQKHQPADGIFTDNPEVTLIMRFADCVPLVFFDPPKRVVGIVHAGWQGTLLQIGGEAVRQLQDRFGIDPAGLRVGIGPSICGECYQVGTAIQEKFVKAWGAEANQFFRQKGGQIFLDLWAANQWTLQKAGVTQIEQSRICTAENLDEWYSYRQEKGITGRFAIVIALKNAPNS